MSIQDLKLDTSAPKTWCPGCPNFAILEGIKGAINTLIERGTPRENIVLVSGVGCNAKIVDYLNINTVYSLHGREVAVAVGIKIGNPKLKVIVSGGDGGNYDEGIAHLVHAAKRNNDITLIIHDNRNFALTVGQFTATSPKGFKGKSSPEGNLEEPFNPLEVMRASGATFIARGYAARIDHFKNLIIKGVEHEGFSLVEILQPCIAWFNTFENYNGRVYELDREIDNEEEAIKYIREWDYKNGGDSKIALGVLYKKQKSAFERDLLGELNPSVRKKGIVTIPESISF